MSINKKLPIAFFCFNRAENAKQALDLIYKFRNSDNEVFVFCDGPRNIKEVSLVQEVHSVIDNYKDSKIFKKEINHGLKNSIISGIDYIFSLGYERVCVIEDDILVGKSFFNFCIESLNKFESDKSVFSVTGFNFPGIFEENKIFKVRRFSSWGWATWKDRWQEINFDPNQNEIDIFLKKNKKQLKEVSENFHEFLQFVRIEKIDSWATFAMFECVKKNMKNIFPCQPLVKNIGFVGGTHFKKSDPISKIYSKFDVDLDQELPVLEIVENAEKKFNSLGVCGKRTIKAKNLQKVIMFFLGLVFGILITK